jgi:hypothetical protein
MDTRAPATWPLRRNPRLAALGLAFAWTATIGASDVSNASSNRWVTDGRVTDAVAQGDVVYLAGTFTRIGRRTGPLTFLDPETLEPMPAPEVTGGDIVAVEPDGVGGYYIAGSFTAVGGRPQRSVARLSATGSVDLAFAPTGIPAARDLVISGDRLFVAVAGLPYNSPSIVALNRLTGSTLPWTPANNGVPARLFALPNGNVVGTLTNPGPVLPLPPTNIEFDRASGAIVDYWLATPQIALDAETVIASFDQTIYQVNVHTRAATVLAAATGACDIVGATCFNMVLESGTLFITGAFTAVGGVARNGAAALDVATGAVLPWRPPDYPGLSRPGGVFVGQGRMYVQYSDGSSTLVACDPVSGAPTGRRGGLIGGAAAALVVEQGRLVVGGRFDGAGGVVRAGLAAIRWPDGRPTEWQPNVGMQPHKLALLGRRVFVAGFGTFSDHGPGWIREVDGTTGLVAAWAAHVDDTILVMRAYGTRLFVAGDFANVGGVARRTLASLDVSGSVPVLESWAPSVSSTQSRFGVVASLDVTPEAVLIAGKLTEAGGQRRWGVAAVDARSGAAFDWAPQLCPESPNGSRNFVEIAASRVWVSGCVSSVNGQPRAGIAAFDLQGALTPWSPQRPDYGRSLNTDEQRATYFEGRVYAGIGYAVDASDGSLTAFSPMFDTSVMQGAWSPAPGSGLVRHGIGDWGFLLFPRVDLPGPVTGLAAATSGTAVTLSWTAVVGAAAYVVEAGSTIGAQDLGRLELDGSTTTLTVPTGNGRYHVRVRARSSGGASTVSDDLVIVVGTDACSAPPQAPLALRAETAGSRVRLEWLLPPGPVLGTIVEASVDLGGSYVEVARQSGAALHFDAQAAPGSYVARVRAANACGIGAPSAPIPVELSTNISPPSVPEKLQVAIGADRTVTLSWQASTGLPTGYVVEVGSEPGLSDLAVTVVPDIALVVTRVPPGTYHVRVRGRNEGGVSPPSNEIIVTVP